ncbi:hypothetical protein [Ornithinibacillus scapharcae]|uniref:hypothetical protein n=1 Tax=Ornithinibacillus scapharcae TaxID=1147159 RepID=UPI000225B25D|nr:hypothetical protein [Ornithinibacillus scapharcae]
MISFTEEQRNEYSLIRDLLNNANSLEEAQYYSNRLNTLIDLARTQNPTATSSFTKEQLDLFLDYKEKLNNAKYPRRVRFYKDKIKALLAEVENTVI